MRTVTLLALGVVVLAGAADEKPPAALKAGDLLPGPFDIFNVNGERADKLSCLVCRNGLNPVAVLFVRAGDDDPVLTDLLQKLDAAVTKHADVKMGAFVVFLYGPKETERTALLEKLRALAKEKDFKNVVLTMAPADWPKEFDAAYALPVGTTARAVLYYRHRVKTVVEFTKDKPLTDKDAGLLLEAVDKLVPPRVQPPKDKVETGAKLS